MYGQRRSLKSKSKAESKFPPSSSNVCSCSDLLLLFQPEKHSLPTAALSTCAFCFCCLLRVDNCALSWPLARAMKYLRSGKRLPASCRLSCEISRELGGSSAVCSLRFGQTLLSCSKAGGIYIYSTDSQLRSRSSSCFGQQTR